MILDHLGCPKLKGQGEDWIPLSQLINSTCVFPLFEISTLQALAQRSDLNQVEIVDEVAHQFRWSIRRWRDPVACKAFENRGPILKQLLME